MKLNVKKIGTAVGSVASKVGFVAKKYSPEILLVAGICGTVTGVVVACKATKKAALVTEELKKRRDSIQEALNRKKNGYEEKNARRDTFLAYKRALWGYIRVYAPAAAIIFASCGCHVGHYSILKKREAAVAAALASTSAAFAEYRNRVSEQVGEEVEQNIYHDVHKPTEEEAAKMTEEGDGVDTSKYVVSSPRGTDRCFDELNPMWVRSPIDNQNFLHQTQAYCNEQLRRHGHIFLNEVYDALHIPRIPEGQILGWIYGKDRDDLHNFVDFGVWSIKDEARESFVRGREASVWLTFNYDGDILAKMR